MFCFVVASLSQEGIVRFLRTDFVKIEIWRIRRHLRSNKYFTKASSKLRQFMTLSTNDIVEIEDAGEICSPSKGQRNIKTSLEQSTAIEKASSSVSPHVAMSRSGKNNRISGLL